MLINYIKVALAVLGRNRFFTFVSLFGISLTLAVLIIVSAFLNQFLHSSYPNFKKIENADTHPLSPPKSEWARH